MMPLTVQTICAAVGGFSAAFLNTVFFMGFLVLLFYGSPYVQGLVEALGVSNPLAFVVIMVGGQAIVEWATCCVMAAAVTVPLRKYLKLN